MILLHHCATLSRDLPTSIFVLTAVSLLTFYINHFGAIMVLRFSSQADFRSFHFHFHHPRRLADLFCMVKAVQQHEDYQQQFQKNKCVCIKS